MAVTLKVQCYSGTFFLPGAGLVPKGKPLTSQQARSDLGSYRAHAPPRQVSDDNWDARQAQPKPVVYIAKTCLHQSCFLLKSDIQPSPCSTKISMPGGVGRPLVDDAWALPPWAVPCVCSPFTTHFPLGKPTFPLSFPSCGVH